MFKRVLLFMFLTGFFLYACGNQNPRSVRSTSGTSSTFSTNQSCVCSEISYQPVCINEGINYTNSCWANCDQKTFSDGTCNSGVNYYSTQPGNVCGYKDGMGTQAYSTDQTRAADGASFSHFGTCQ